MIPAQKNLKITKTSLEVFLWKHFFTLDHPLRAIAKCIEHSLDIKKCMRVTRKIKQRSDRNELLFDEKHVRRKRGFGC